MQDEKLRCDFCGAPISALDLLRGRAVVVFRRRYCPTCMSAAIARGKSSSGSRYNTPNPAMRRNMSPLAAPVIPPKVSSVPPAAAGPGAPASAKAPAPAPGSAFAPSLAASFAALPPELPVSLMAVLPNAVVEPAAPVPAASRPAPSAPPAAPKPHSGPQATRRLKVGEHGCGFYSSEEDRRYQLGPFLRDGLEGNEKVLHFLRAPSPEKILGDFRSAGLHAQKYLKSGQLEIVPIAKLLGNSGVFQPSAIIERILQAADKALEDDFSRLRISCEMTWALGSQVDVESLVEFEMKLTALAVRGKCTCLCQYNVYRFDSKSLHQIRKNHPYVFAKGTAAMVMRELEPSPEAERV